MKAKSPGKRPARQTEPADHLRTRAGSIVRILKKRHPEATTALHHSNPLELLVSTILSAQCTDERVNMVTPQLFSKYRTASDYAQADPAAFEQEIRSTGFFRSKTKSILACTAALIGEHQGKVPDTMEALVRLPGVGRKTANVVLGMAFGKAEGIVVDTHVRRLSGRLGFSRRDDPEKIEQDLMAIIPKKDWVAIGNLLILHGRDTCQARKPKCPACALKDLCPSAEGFMGTTGQ